MKTIIYLNEVILMKKILAISLLLFGIGIFIFENIYAGFFLMLLGLNFIVTEGTEIDLESKTYRTVKSIFGKNFGKWQPCPEFEYVSVFKTLEVTAVSSHGAQMATFRNDIILLNLFYIGNKYFTVYKTSDKKDAFEVADHLKLALNIDILDATSSEKKWL